MKRLIAILYRECGRLLCLFEFIGFSFIQVLPSCTKSDKNILALFLMRELWDIDSILERLEFLAYSMRVGSSFVCDSYYFSIDLPIFWLGFSIVESLLWFFSC